MTRPFGDVLGELAGGTTHERMTELLAEVVTAVQEIGKPGELSLSLKIKPNGTGGVAVEDVVKAKNPEAPRGQTLFFTDADGGLHRRDPRQQDLPLRQVEPQEDTING